MLLAVATTLSFSRTGYLSAVMFSEAQKHESSGRRHYPEHDPFNTFMSKFHDFAG